MTSTWHRIVAKATALAFVGMLTAISAHATRLPSAGRFPFAWDAARGLKTGRQAAVTSARDLTAGLDLAATYDAVHRLAASDVGGVGVWNYGYGKADELGSIATSTTGRDDLTSGPEGRPLSRATLLGTALFSYDLEGRRIEDERFLSTYDWRGRLVQRDVKVGAHAGARIVYAHDAGGRLLSRTEIGPIPTGGTDADRPFVAKRAFVWDGATLTTETGLNFQDQPIWRQSYLPGPVGLDDAPLVLVERGLQTPTPDSHVYALVRDEMGTVVAVAEAGTPTPRLLARYLGAPYGQLHIELGPELVEARFDETIVKVASDTQATPIPNQLFPGGVRITATMPLDPTTFAAGILIEQQDPVTGTWTNADRTTWAIGQDQARTTDLLIMPKPGWPKGQTYRLTLTSALADGFGRAIRLPAKETAGVRLELGAASDGSKGPSLERHFVLELEDEPAGNTLGGAFPGGQTSLYQGLWHDPIGNIAYARNRWLDPTNASWLSGDPLGPVDSPNLYAYVAWQPHMYSDPLGLAAVVTNNGMVVIADDDSDTKIVKQRRALAVKDQRSRERIAFLMRELGGLDQDQVNALLIKLYRAEKEAYARAASQLGVDEPAIRAVAQVETMKKPFLSTGHPTVLFERHKFHQFTGGAFDQAGPDLSNPTPGGYGPVSMQPQRLARAKALDETAAIDATSWGQFQIMGFNYAAAGYQSPQQFERAMRTTELEHLEAFVNFVGANPSVLNALRQHNWPAFAASYNGPAYAINQYDLKMAQAYQALTGAQPTP